MNLSSKITKKMPPAACGRRWVALRATWGVWWPPGRTRRNKYSDPLITNPTPPLPISRKSRSGEERKKERKKEFYFFWNYNILLFVNKKTHEIGLTMCRKVRFHVWKLIWNGPLKRNTLSESQRSQSKKKISGFKKVVPTGSNRIPWPLQPDISVW